MKLCFAKCDQQTAHSQWRLHIWVYFSCSLYFVEINISVTTRCVVLKDCAYSNTTFTKLKRIYWTCTRGCSFFDGWFKLRIPGARDGGSARNHILVIFWNALVFISHRVPKLLTGDIYYNISISVSHLYNINESNLCTDRTPSGNRYKVLQRHYGCAILRNCP